MDCIYRKDRIPVRLSRPGCLCIYEVLPQILELWGDNLMTEVAAKKGLAEVSGK